MEQKAKWIYIGESDEFFTKSKFYPEIDRASTKYGDMTEEQFRAHIDSFEIDKPMEDGYKFFIDNDGEPHIMDKEVWQIKFYRL